MRAKNCFTQRLQIKFSKEPIVDIGRHKNLPFVRAGVAPLSAAPVSIAAENITMRLYLRHCNKDGLNRIHCHSWKQLIQNHPVRFAIGETQSSNRLGLGYR
ncbi:hypothetical protein [Ochrobactrum sp. 19YEA23]|uniref:hypothetical protein n=1 Tax=Ochrobactrum sp. 19YEA23 TaxID=3039854 RepID=UPI00247891E4